MKKFTSQHSQNYICRLLRAFIVLLCIALATNACSKSKPKAVASGSSGALAGMIEIELIGADEEQPYPISDNINLQLKSIETGAEYVASTKGGYYAFDELPIGKYKLYAAVINAKGSNLREELREYIFCQPDEISFFKRIVLRRQTFDSKKQSKGLLNRRIEPSYDFDELGQFIQNTFKERPDLVRSYYF